MSSIEAKDTKYNEQFNNQINPGRLPSFRFNIMVAGETGMGKSTFLKITFRPFASERQIIEAGLDKIPNKTMQIEEIGSFTLDAGSLDCNVHLFDSRGYGDLMNSSTTIDRLQCFLQEKHYKWLDLRGNTVSEEDRHAADERIHCLFYFIAPHRFKDIDIEFIKKLHKLVPIVPVIAKADTMTIEELKKHLETVKECLDQLQKESGSDKPIQFMFDEDIDESFIDMLIEQQHSSGASSDNTATSLERTEEDAEVDQSKSDISNDYTDKESASVKEETVATPVDVNDESTAKAETSSENNPADQDLEYSHMYASEYNPQPAVLLPERTVTLEKLPKARSIFAIVCDSSPSGLRRHTWGTVDINNKEHSDFHRLQRLVFKGNHITLLRKTTQEFSLAILNESIMMFGPFHRQIRSLIKVSKQLMEVLHWYVVLFGWVVSMVALLGLLLSGGDMELFGIFCRRIYGILTLS